MKVDKFVKGAVRQFAYWFAHGTIGSGLLNGIDYVSDLQEESSFAEQVFIIFMNILEYDELNPGMAFRGYLVSNL